MTISQRHSAAIAIAQELNAQGYEAAIRNDSPGLTLVDCARGRAEVTDDGVVVTTRRGVSAGWTHSEASGPQHSALRASVLIRSVA